MVRKLIYALCFLLTTTATHAGSIDQLLRNKHTPFVGNPHAKVTVIEFFDYQCGYCVRIANSFYQLIQKNPSAKFQFIDFPIRGETSERAARAALAANLQHQYFGLHQALLTSSLALTSQSIMDIAFDRHLNLVKLKKDMFSHMIDQQLDMHNALAQTFGINVTPAFVIAKTNASKRDDLTVLLGAADMSEIQSAIDHLQQP